MGDDRSRPRSSRAQLATVVESPIVFFAAVLLVHYWLARLGIDGPNQPLGDVTLYSYWVHEGLDAHRWVGLDLPWVYPVGALVPILVADVFGSGGYVVTWLVMVLIVDLAVFAFLVVPRRGTPRDPSRLRVAWWWLGLLLALGPVALGRLDSITAPIAIVGMVLLLSRPRLAGVLLAAATWIKAWPAALIAAAVITVPARLRLLVGVAGASIVVVVVALLLGGGGQLFGFVGRQTGRGLQLESGFGSFWLWDAARHGGSSIYFDQQLVSYQIRGPGVDAVAGVTTLLLILAVAALLVIGAVLTRRGAAMEQLLPPLALAITTALIVFNKVGSPQYVTWLAVPIVFGLVTAATGRGPSFRMPAVLVLVIAALTQAIYPFLYRELLLLQPLPIVLLDLRNLLYLVLLGWAVRTLVRRGRRPVGPDRLVDPATLAG